MLTKKQNDCVHLMVHEPELTQIQIAERIGVSNQSITNWKRNEEFREAVQKLMDEEWEEMAKIAQKRILELAQSNNDSVALGAVKFILASNGREVVEKVKSDNTIKHVIVVDD